MGDELCTGLSGLAQHTSMALAARDSTPSAPYLNIRQQGWLIGSVYRKVQEHHGFMYFLICPSYLDVGTCGNCSQANFKI